MDKKIKLMSSRSKAEVRCRMSDVRFSILCLLSSVLCLLSSVPGKTSPIKRILVLPDGYMLSGVDGKLTEQDRDTWFFEFKLDITDSTGRASIGAKLELLPSSTLERMIADANANSATSYRLWARITKYKDRNFIFPTKFLPLSEAKETPLASAPVAEAAPATVGLAIPNGSEGAKPEAQPTQQKVGEPNDEDELGIPKEILDKLKTGTSSPLTGRERPERLARAVTGRPTQVKQNFILANRVGFWVKQADGSMVFRLDAFGQSAGSIGGTIRLLPCQALEVAEQKQSFAPGMIRFMIAGIVTEYKGEQFLLLHRAVRAYNNGNFDI